MKGPAASQTRRLESPAGLMPALERAVCRLGDRLKELNQRLEAGDETAWAEYRETAGALAEILGRLAPERRGALLTTAEMAERYGISRKTLLKRKARGEIRPAVQRGKLIRWRGDELVK